MDSCREECRVKVGDDVVVTRGLYKGRTAKVSDVYEALVWAKSTEISKPAGGVYMNVWRVDVEFEGGFYHQYAPRSLKPLCVTEEEILAAGAKLMLTLRELS